MQIYWISREERLADMFKERDFVVKGFEDQLKVFLRGRVSYLFDYYSLNFGISSLCLVLGDGNHEVAQLPAFDSGVDSWNTWGKSGGSCS